MRGIVVSIEWQAPANLENVRQVLRKVKERIEMLFQNFEVFAVRNKPFVRLNIDYALDRVRRGTFDAEHKNNFATKGFGMERWGGFSLPLDFSPLTPTTIGLWLDGRQGNLKVSFQSATSSILWQGLPIDEQAAKFKDGVWPEDEEDDDASWATHYEPAWPKNAAILMEIVDSVKDLFPLISLEIPPEVAEPEKHCDMELSEVLQLTNQPPEGFETA